MALTPRSCVMTALFSGAALMNAAMAVASAVATIVAADRLGTRWGGVPSTAGIVGTGAGALALTWLMNRRGRRTGLVAGYLASACGAVLAALAVAAVDVLLLSIGMTLLGLGNAGAQLSRYAAAELYPAGRRGFAISMVVWAGAVGAVGGPLLLGPSGEAATAVGWTASTGPFLFASLATLGAAFAVVGVRPPLHTALGEAIDAGHASPPARAMAGGVPTRAAPGVPATARVRLREVARRSGARTALAVMATAQVVMVAVMTATPLDMHMHGQGMGSIGVTLSAHTLGMFALSPLTGRILDGVGPRPVMLGGLLTLVVATIAATATSDGHALTRTGALFLLGYGWNLCFVGGSGRLARDLPDEARTSVEGAVDAAVWSIAAAASLTSTVVLSAAGYTALAWAACAVAALPAALLLRPEAR